MVGDAPFPTAQEKRELLEHGRLEFIRWLVWNKKTLHDHVEYHRGTYHKEFVVWAVLKHDARNGTNRKPEGSHKSL